MSQPESNKHSTKWMIVAMVCCAIPIVFSLLLLVVFLGRSGQMVGLALLRTNNNLVMTGYRIFSDAPGLYRSMDGGKTWEKLWADTKGVVLKVAIAPSNPRILYAINENNRVFQSQDGGQTWNELG